MKTKQTKPMILTALCAAMGLLAACGGSGDDVKPSRVAVYGDSPYGADLVEFKATPAFIANVNADKDLALVAHVGDLHSGSEPCTQVYDQAISQLFKQYTLPLVYVPGDNEWADCHKAKQMNGTYSTTDSALGYPINTVIPSYANGNPVDNLQLIRSLFFAKSGQTLGSGKLTVHSQADEGKSVGDKQFVENTWWIQSNVVFTTVNIPGGSNNGTDIWGGATQPTAQQTQEIATRTAATLAWLTNAFDQASAQGAKAIVIMSQADMWDADGKPISHLSEYKQYIDLIAARTAQFGKPVLMFNGDSHLFRSDNPLMKGAPCVIEPLATDGTTSGAAAQACTNDPYNNNQPGASYAVSNFRRIVVHGSTMPMEWIKLNVDPTANATNSTYSFGPFSWERKVVR